MFLTTLIIYLLTISACFSPWQDNVGTFSINLNSSSSARNTTWDDEPFDIEEMINDHIDDIFFTVKLTNGPGPDEIHEDIRIKNAKGGSQLSFSVMPGKWTITVEAYAQGYWETDGDDGYNGTGPIGGSATVPGTNDDNRTYFDLLIAVGERTVTINPGKNRAVNIDMYLEEWGDDDWHYGGETIIVHKHAGTNLADQLEWISKPENIRNGNEYIIEVFTDAELTKTYAFSGFGSNITIYLQSYHDYMSGDPFEVKTVEKASAHKESMFIIEAGVSLVVQSITLKGHDNSEASLIQIYSGNLILNGGGVIKENKGPFDSIQVGGGVGVYSGGYFELSGGKIYGNEASSFGGGVYVHGGTFFMSSGEIFSNIAPRGGGVYINDGSFTKFGGTITGFTSSPEPNSNVAHGVDDNYERYGNAVHATSDYGTKFYINVTVNEDEGLYFKGTNDASSVNDDYPHWIEE